MGERFRLNCRMCDSENLLPFLNLGEMPPADGFLSSANQYERNYPLELLSCRECGLVQLSYVVPGEILYCEDYPYDASTATTAQKHWQEFATSVSKQEALTANDLVVDIGSNVGILLQSFRNNGCRIQGVDPAANITKLANAKGIETITGFFDSQIAKRIVEEKGRASIITGTNVFAHVDDLKSFMQAVDILLNEKGTLIIEVPYFVNLLEKFQYDTIYHEHLSYITIMPLEKFVGKFGMYISNIQEQDFHGGSLRISIKKGIKRGISADFIVREMFAGVYQQKTLEAFAEKVAKNREILRELIYSIKRNGKMIAVVSTPAKGMTLLNYCNFEQDVFEFATEKAPLKIGKFTPGTHIPVLPDSALYEKCPNYALLLAWNFADEIMKNLSSFKDGGGKFIIPVPIPRIV